MHLSDRCSVIPPCLRSYFYSKMMIIEEKINVNLKKRMDYDKFPVLPFYKIPAKGNTELT